MNDYRRKVKRRLKKAGFFVTVRRRLANDLGTQLRLSSGPVVNVYDTGRITVQGKNTEVVEEVKEVLGLAQTPGHRTLSMRRENAGRRGLR